MKDVNVMTEEYTRYGRRRMKAMIRMKELSEEWLKERDTPLQRLVLQNSGASFKPLRADVRHEPLRSEVKFAQALVISQIGRNVVLLL